jgi:hypothetical protein
MIILAPFIQIDDAMIKYIHLFCSTPIHLTIYTVSLVSVSAFLIGHCKILGNRYVPLRTVWFANGVLIFH